MVMSATINLDLHRQHAMEGASCKRIKRSFGLPVNQSDSSHAGGWLAADIIETEEGEGAGGSFASLRGHLLADLAADEDFGANTHIPIPAQTLMVCSILYFHAMCYSILKFYSSKPPLPGSGRSEKFLISLSLTIGTFIGSKWNKRHMGILR